MDAGDIKIHETYFYKPFKDGETGGWVIILKRKDSSSYEAVFDWTRSQSQSSSSRNPPTTLKSRYVRFTVHSYELSIKEPRPSWSGYTLLHLFDRRHGLA